MNIRLCLCAVISLILIGPQPAIAQTPSPTLIKYGDVIADKFTPDHTRFEYQFEADEGDLVVVTADEADSGYTTNADGDVLIPSETNDDGSVTFQIVFTDIRFALVSEDGEVLDENRVGMFYGENHVPNQVFGQLKAGTYTILIENIAPSSDAEIQGAFVFKLDRARLLKLDAPITGETFLDMTEIIPAGWEQGSFVVSVPEDGYFDLHYQLSTKGFESTIYLYDAQLDRSVVSTTLLFEGAPNNAFAGVMTYPLLADQLYAVVLTTLYYRPSDYLPVNYELELTATPADKLPHSD